MKGMCHICYTSSVELDANAEMIIDDPIGFFMDPEGFTGYPQRPDILNLLNDMFFVGYVIGLYILIIYLIRKWSRQ